MATRIAPHPMYGWDPDRHDVTCEQAEASGVYRVYEVRDHGDVVGSVVSRSGGTHSGRREWDYVPAGVDRASVRQAYGLSSRHDAVLALLESRARESSR